MERAILIDSLFSQLTSNDDWKEQEALYLQTITDLKLKKDSWIDIERLLLERKNEKYSLILFLYRFFEDYFSYGEKRFSQEEVEGMVECLKDEFNYGIKGGFYNDEIGEVAFLILEEFDCLLKEKEREVGV